MNHDSAAPDDFLQAVRCAFVGAGVATPRDGEASALVFDSARWLAHVAAAAGWLGAEERQRAERFRFERDYATYVLAHGSGAWRWPAGLDGTRARYRCCMRHPVSRCCRGPAGRPA